MLPSGSFNTSYDKDIVVVQMKTRWLFLAMGLIFLFTSIFFDTMVKLCLNRNARAIRIYS